jgi:SAM-dependent methyltransferase
VDLVLLVNAYHHVENRPGYFSSLARSLLPGGRVAIIEFHPDSPMAPPHKLAKEQVIEELSQAGYRLATEHAFLPEQYLLVFARAG